MVRERRRRFTSAFLILTSLLHWLCLKLCSQALACPAWWQRGQPRQRFQSFAEAELLSQLAVLLMPHEDIGESFRRYPVERSSSWGSSYLEPGLSAYGVLQDDAAALFVEYDGYYLHRGVRGVPRRQRRHRALLKFAPPGSCIVRLGRSQMPMEPGVYHIRIKEWHDHRSLLLTVRTIVQHLMHDLTTNFLCDDVVVGMQQFLDAYHLSNKASEWVQCISVGQHAKLRLDRLIKWLTELGLTSVEVGRVVARFPQVLSYSIEENLRPTVLWLSELGLTEAQVARTVARFPQVLSCSIEENLRPTVLWLSELGLTEAQVACAVARFPQVLSYSIQENLQPTVLWLGELGLTEAQVAHVVARFPQILGCSIDTNLKPKVAILRMRLSRDQLVESIVRLPPLLAYSRQRLTTRIDVLSANNLLSVTRLVSYITYTPDRFDKRFFASGELHSC